MNSVSVKFLFDFGSPNAYLCQIPSTSRGKVSHDCCLCFVPYPVKTA